MTNQKLKLLYLAKILHEHSDDGHPLTTNEIIEKLAQYDISIERKTLPLDIEALQSFGYDIICERGANNMYHMGNRVFELPELKLLADAVGSSRFITARKSRKLIEKLQGLTSQYQASQLQRQVFVSDRLKTENEHVYLNIDHLHEAINEHKKITFLYFDFDINLNKVYRYNGSRYTVSPYGLAWVNENYYMIGFHERRNDICHFRIDKMDRLKVTEDPQVPVDENANFDIADYVSKVFLMYSGKNTTVQLQFDRSLLNVVLDRFGNDVFFTHKDEEHIIISTEVCVSPTFLSWLFQFGDKVKIISPSFVIEMMKEACKAQASQY